MATTCRDKKFFEEIFESKQKHPYKIAPKCPLIVKDKKSNLGGNQNEKLSSLSPVVKGKQTASKNL